MRKRMEIGELITVIDCARILGITRPTFRRRLRNGKYKFRAKKIEGVLHYSIYDIMRVAHPQANDVTINALIMKFRQDKPKYKKRI